MNIASLEHERLDAAAVALGRAFQDDPLQSYVFPDPVERAARSPALFSPILSYGLRFGKVFTTSPETVGASVWLPPDEWRVTPERAAEAGLDRLPEFIGKEAADRFLSVISFGEVFHEQDVPSAHWYTMVIGVAPEGRGRGLGRALMEPILNIAAADGLPCYLETAQSTNIDFYKHLGFQVVRELVEPKSKIQLWTFRQDAP